MVGGLVAWLGGWSVGSGWNQPYCWMVGLKMDDPGMLKQVSGYW